MQRLRVAMLAWAPYAVMAASLAAMAATIWRGYTFAPPGEEPVALDAQAESQARWDAWLAELARAPLFGALPSKPTKAAQPPAQALPPARLDAQLVGVITGPLAAAILLVHGKQAVYWLGDEVAPGVRLVEVGADYAVVEHGGRRERLALIKPKQAAFSPRPMPAPKRTVARAPVVPQVQRRRIPRPWLRRQLAHLPEILRQARVVPRYENGKFAGFMITNIVPGSVYEKIGLQNGDVIQAVNGVVVKTPQEAMQLYEKLKDASHIAVKIKRRGVEMTLNYEMR